MTTTPGRWVFSGSAWYWQHKHAGTALIRETGMPDRAVLRFDLAWKNRLSVAIGFHADFARPKPPKEGEDDKAGKVRAFVPGDASDLPRLFGNSYVLQMYSNYLMLYRTSVSEDGTVSHGPRAVEQQQPAARRNRPGRRWKSAATAAPAPSRFSSTMSSSRSGAKATWRGRRWREGFAGKGDGLRLRRAGR